MISRAHIDKTLKNMILSASGWRGIFASDGGEESKSEKISESHKIICGAAAFVFAEFLKIDDCKPVVLLGTDTRPTGNAIVEAMIPVLLSQGCDVKFAGVTAAPEIMAWAKSFINEQGKSNRASTGFIYVSASHNPIGHNGLKFGLTDGGVLAAADANKLIDNFRNFLSNDENINSLQGDRVYSLQGDDYKKEAYKAYYDFCNEIICGSRKNDEFTVIDVIKNSLDKNPLGIVCDFNGSARTVSIDKEFFTSLGLKFECINGEPGQIAHRIVPEGESLEPCEKLLDEIHKRDSSFVIGYVPDCDGDRGNLVILDDKINKSNTLSKARALEAQEVFALAVVAEICHLVWTGELTYGQDGKPLVKVAVAVNDPTSMRIDRIAECFGVSVFRAEVGEANVVSLARKLRKDGYLVRILGEGSAGGNITHPSAVRDPINTVLAIVKMLSVRFAANAEKNSGGFFKIWLELSGQTKKFRDDFTLADIIESLPAFVTTPAYDKNAVMRVKTEDHALLKERYQKIFLREWEEQKDFLKSSFNLYAWEAIAYNGTEEKRELKNFAEARRGGLKILFFDNERRETAFIWMRGSATEPVFRIMADVSGANKEAEQWLLNWQRTMIMKAEESE